MNQRIRCLRFALIAVSVVAGVTAAPAFANHVCDHDGDGEDATWCGGTDCDDNENGFVDDWDQDGLTPLICGGTDCYDNDPSCTTECGSDLCAPYCDADGDARIAIACGGEDCADDDDNRYPGNAEVCDALDHDEDCDYSTFGYRDADGDGAVDDACCNEDPSTQERICGTDCDDMKAAVHPGATEACDYIDNDCDGGVDAGPGVPLLQVLAYLDADGDGWGDGSSGASLCPHDVLKQARTPRSGDCADGVHSQNPGAIELCNGIDDDCNGLIDDNVSNSVPRPVEICNGVDDDCNGLIDDDVAAIELCNGIDDDCDGLIDEGLSGYCD